jgi:hypothetical protein
MRSFFFILVYEIMIQDACNDCQGYVEGISPSGEIDHIHPTSLKFGKHDLEDGGGAIVYVSCR